MIPLIIIILLSLGFGWLLSWWLENEAKSYRDYAKTRKRLYRQEVLAWWRARGFSKDKGD